MTISSVKTGTIGDSLLAGNAAFDPASFVSIATFTGNGTSSTYTFSSIPQTYVALQLRILANDAAAATLQFRLNGDSGGNYTNHALKGDGSAASATGVTANTQGDLADYAGYTTDTFAAVIVDIHDYASTTKNKTVRTFSGADLNGSGFVNLRSSLYSSTTAITSLTIRNAASATYVTGSVFSLYGIKG
jgi:hypothetical protein